jgi:hypothetical protein
MQLKRKPARRNSGAAPLGTSLAAATCALLGTASPAAALAQDIGDWQFDTAAFYYGEGDNRVQDLSVNILARGQVAEDKFLNFTFGYDTLTGASPNGAAPSAQTQVFARPISLTRSSGGTVSQSGGNYTIEAGQLPVDDSFQDQRIAGSVGWQQALGRFNVFNVGASASSETDYTHVGLNTQIARDFNSRNTTLSAGLAWAYDTVKPVGGFPIPFSAITAAEVPSNPDDDGGASRPKQVADLLLGLTQVLGRHTIAQLNYSVSRSDGYLTDPYKFMSVVDPITGENLPGPDEGTGYYVYENRPDFREKRSIYGLLKEDIGGDVLSASYRHMTDDWGIASDTVDLHYRWNFDHDRYLQPHVRYYSQTAADFYHTVLFDGQPFPEYATADYRLGKFDAITLGLKYGQHTEAGEVSMRLELYRQSGSPSPESLVGSLKDVNLTPDLTAILAEFSYNFGT